MTQLVKVEELNKIAQGLEAFEARKSELEALAESAKGLNVTSSEDKEGYRLISEKRKVLKSARVQVEKEGKAMRDLINPITKMVSAKEKELVAIVEPEESRLIALEKWVESELERIRQEKEEAERARIQQRIDALAVYGVAIDYSTILGMTDDQFDAKLSAARVEFEQEQARLEAERIAAEKARMEEMERVKAEREELARLRAERDAEEAKLRAEREQIEAERKAIEAEKQRLEDEKQAAIRAEEKRLADIEAAKQREIELEAARKEAAEKAIREQKEKEERERIAAERKAARQPDKAKLFSYANEIAQVAPPAMKSDEGKAILVQFKASLVKAIEALENAAESL